MLFIHILYTFFLKFYFLKQNYPLFSPDPHNIKWLPSYYYGPKPFYGFLPRGETNGCEVNFTEFKLMATLSLKERSLARQLAKRPYYSYGTTSVARLLGIKKVDLVALAKSLGDKTGDQVQRSTPILA